MEPGDIIDAISNASSVDFETPLDAFQWCRGLAQAYQIEDFYLCGSLIKRQEEGHRRFSATVECGQRD